MVTYFMDLPYLTYFNLKEEPFSTVPSPRFYYLSSQHGIALEKTAYAVGARKGISAVFGDTGTGKSSLARLLHDKFLSAGFISTLITNPSYPTANSFLRTIAQEFGTGKTDKSFKGMLDILKEFLFEQAITNGRTIVLTIDEAQTLKPPLIELLRQLANYETNEMKLLQLVLFAQEELRTTLARPKLHNFRSRIVMASTLEKLSPDELAAMLQFRWNVASGSADHPFEDGAIAAIYRYSDGMPREANILADNALLAAYYQKQRRIDDELIHAVASDRISNLAIKEPTKNGRSKEVRR
jgi:general secretion pathway protein A